MRIFFKAFIKNVRSLNSHSLKVMMKKDIDSKVKTVYKPFEYLDDYSYGTSKKNWNFNSNKSSRIIKFTFICFKKMVLKIFQLLENT